MMSLPIRPIVVKAGAALAGLGVWAGVWLAAPRLDAAVAVVGAAVYSGWLVAAAKTTDYFCNRGTPPMPPCLGAFAATLGSGGDALDGPVHAASLCAGCPSDWECPHLPREAPAGPRHATAPSFQPVRQHQGLDRRVGRHHAGKLRAQAGRR
jgi:hypothetical protein